MSWRQTMARALARSFLPLAVLAAGPAWADQAILPLPAGPPAVALTDCHPIDFESAEITGTGLSARLRVKGKAPAAGLTIALIPVMYVMMPEYWQIVLVGCAGRVQASQGADPFNVVFSLAGSIGRKGILLVGSSPGNEKRLDVFN